MRTRALIAVVVVAVCSTVASAQNADAPASIPPVPGAMPNTDDVPSALSLKNAQDDALPVPAYRLKHMTDAQRQTIYRALIANQNAAKPANPSTQHFDIGMALPLEAPLQPVPADLARGAPGLESDRGQPADARRADLSASARHYHSVNLPS
jgi:hypothetical protein